MPGSDAALAQNWLFADVSPELLRPVVESAREVRFLPGEVIFREGDQADGLYLIAAGSILVFSTGETGEPFSAMVQANEALGEMGVLDDEPRSATARAMTFCDAHFVAADPFLDLLERSPLVCMRLMLMLTNRLRRANGRLGELAPMQIIPPEVPYS